MRLRQLHCFFRSWFSFRQKLIELSVHHQIRLERQLNRMAEHETFGLERAVARNDVESRVKAGDSSVPGHQVRSFLVLDLATQTSRMRTAQQIPKVGFFFVGRPVVACQYHETAAAAYPMLTHRDTALSQKSRYARFYWRTRHDSNV